jgi:hypothetical protein
MRILSIVLFVGVIVGHSAESPDLSPQKIIPELITGHGEKAHEKDGWFVLNNGPIRVQGEFVSVQHHTNSVIVQFDFRAENYAPNKTLIESNAGVGTTLEEAQKDAYISFMSGSFHTLLAGLVNHKCEQVEREHITINGRQRTLVVGGVQIKNMKTVDNNKGYTDWYNQLLETIKSSDLSEGRHWIRVYIGQYSNMVQIKEVLLDNDEWDLGKGWIEKYEWPKQEEFYSVRLFVMIE